MPGPSHRDGQGCLVRWSGRQAVAVLPGQLDVANVGPVREHLLTVINRGASVLIADMSATLSCDYAGADALTRVYRRAVANGTDLRLVISAPVVRRAIALSGLDRLVPVFPTREAAQAAPPLAAVLSLPPRVVPSTRSASLVPPEGPRPVSRLPVAIPGSPGRGAQQGMQRHEFEDTLTRITSGVFEVGLTLQTVLDQPAVLRRAVERALELLDGIVRDARTAAFAWHDHGDHVLADAGEPGVAVRPGTLARAGSLSAMGEHVARWSKLVATEAHKTREWSHKARAQSRQVRGRTLEVRALSQAATGHASRMRQRAQDHTSTG